MTHKVNAAVLRIGKSLNWHSLGSPLYRWRDLKMNLFLNYFLARFLEKESYRLVRYGIRSENKVFKIAIIAFRVITTTRSLPRGTTKSSFETYWGSSFVYKYKFKLGVVRYAIQGFENRMMPLPTDAAGIIHVDKKKNFFSIGPHWNWDKTFIFFNDGASMADNDPGESDTLATIGFSGKYYVRMAAKLMVLRFAVKKSLMRVIRKRILPEAPKVFMRVPRTFDGLLKFKNYFNKLPLGGLNFKNLLFFFLLSRARNKKYLKLHFYNFSRRIKKKISFLKSIKKFKLARRRRGKKNFLKLKKDYFLFKKKYLFWRKRIKRISLNRKNRFFRKGYYNLKKFFTMLRREKKNFKHESVFSAVTASKVKTMRRLMGYKRSLLLKKKINCFYDVGFNVFDGFLKSIASLLATFNARESTIKFFLFALLLKRNTHLGPEKTALKNFRSFLAPFSRIFPIFNFKKKKILVFRPARAHLAGFCKLYVLYAEKKLGMGILKKIRRLLSKIKKLKLRKLKANKLKTNKLKSKLGATILKIKELKAKKTSILKIEELRHKLKTYRSEINKLKTKKPRINKPKTSNKELKNFLILKLKNFKINFFFYFFLTSMSVFKSYRLRFKPNTLKQLYRKKKLIIFLESRLSAFLKSTIMLKFFNPLNFTSMDDQWTKSLFESLNFITGMYLRDKFDYKPAFMLSLYTMLSYKYHSPAFLGSYIANQLEWRWRKRSHMSFIRLLMSFFKSLRFNTIYSKNLLNFSVGFYGKVWGKLRAGKFIIRTAHSDALPLRRISLTTDSSFTWAESQFGTFGIRIWIARN